MRYKFLKNKYYKLAIYKLLQFGQEFWNVMILSWITHIGQLVTGRTFTFGMVVGFLMTTYLQ